MRICESVEGLASALAAHVRRAALKDPTLVVYLAEIGAMPLWRDMRALGRFNLYSATKPEATKAEFERVRRLLIDAGVANVPPSSDFDFADW